MVVGLGVDLFDVHRMEAELSKADSGFTRQLFSPEEIERCERQRRPVEHFARCFAAKEAVAKALGGGAAVRISWPDIEIRDGPLGKYEVALSGDARRRAEALGVEHILLSVALARGIASASAVLEAS